MNMIFNKVKPCDTTCGVTPTVRAEWRHAKVVDKPDVGRAISLVIKADAGPIKAVALKVSVPAGMT